MFKKSSLQNLPWSSLRRRERVGIGLAVVFIPGTIVLGWPLSEVLGSEIAFLGVALAWMAMILFVVFWCGSFRCPRCKNPFYWNWGYQGSYARKCAYCGLPKWAEFDQNKPWSEISKYDLYAEANKLAVYLDKEGYTAEANALRDAMAYGSTGTEICMSLRFHVSAILRRIPLSGEYRLKVLRLVAELNVAVK